MALKTTQQDCVSQQHLSTPRSYHFILRLPTLNTTMTPVNKNLWMLRKEPLYSAASVYHSAGFDL